MTESQDRSSAQGGVRGGGRGGGGYGGDFKRRGGGNDFRGRGRGFGRGGRGGKGNRGSGKVSPTLQNRASPLESEELFSKVATTGINFSKYENIPVKVEGDQPPSPVNTVDQAGLCRVVRDNVAKVGYSSFTPVQKHAIPIVLAGRDLMACAQTGSGKTAAFLLPIINSLVSSYQPRTVEGCHKPMCLIITPTRELAIQIYTEVKKFSHTSPLKSALCYGGVSTGNQLASFSQGCDILVATPGRLIDFVGQGKVGFHMIKYLVLDEADRMLDMGFMPDVKRIVGNPHMTPKGERVTLMFSATFPPVIRKVADQFLHRFIFLTVGVVGGACTDVTQKFYQVAKKDKKDRLTSLLGELGSSKTLVFIRTKHKTHRIAQQLYREGFACNSIHGDRSQGQRELALAQFRDGVSTVLLATAVVARGLDIPEVANVINYDMPGEIEEYVHRIGRTGRVGNNGQAISFWDMDEDGKIQRDLVRILTESGQMVPEWLKLDIGGKDGPGKRGKGGGKQSAAKEGRHIDKENCVLNGQEAIVGNKKQGINVVSNSKKSELNTKSQDENKRSAKKESINNQSVKNGPKIKENSEQIADVKAMNSDATENEMVGSKKRPRNRKGGKSVETGSKSEEKEVDNGVSDEKNKRKRNRNRGKKEKSDTSTPGGSDHQRGEDGGAGEEKSSWSAGRQASLPEMSRGDRNGGPGMARRTASQYEFCPDAGSGGQGPTSRQPRIVEHAREGGMDENTRNGWAGRSDQTREQGRSYHAREGDKGRQQHARDGHSSRGGHDRGLSRPAMPSAPVADIIGILNQQARGGGAQDQGDRGGSRETSSYRPHVADRQEFRGMSGGRGGGGGGGPPAQVNTDVADLASLLELKARLAQENAGTGGGGRREGGRRRQETRDLANTSHWPAL